MHRGGRGQRLEYELLYDGADEDQPHLMGLIDPEKLDSHPYDDQKSGSKAQKIGQKPQKIAPSLGQVRPKSGQVWVGKMVLKPIIIRLLAI